MLGTAAVAAALMITPVMRAQATATAPAPAKKAATKAAPKALPTDAEIADASAATILLGDMMEMVPAAAIDDPRKSLRFIFGQSATTALRKQ